MRRNRRRSSGPWIGAFVAVCASGWGGCAEGFLSIGSFFTNIGDGLRSAGQCLTPLEPTLLNEVLFLATPLDLEAGVVEVTDVPQPEVVAFFEERIGSAILPSSYLRLRFFQLGPLNRGDVIVIEPLGDRVSFVALYDETLTLIPGGQTNESDGKLRTVRIPIVDDGVAHYLRIDFRFLSETGDPVARITRQFGVGPQAPRPQTVLLNFAGAPSVTFRYGNILPTAVGSLDDARIRAITIEIFKAYYDPFNVTVLTDEDARGPGPISVIHIGPATPPFGLFGLAELVDDQNRHLDDVAIVDTNRPELQLARLFGPDTLGRAIGGVAAHEMGHMLGLYHVSDPDALMTGARCQGVGLDIDRLLERQFRHAPLTFAASNFQQWAIGFQDPADYLLSILGPRPK